MNKRGYILDIIIFVVLAFVVVMFLGLWYYGNGLINDHLSAITTPIGTTTVGAISDSTFGGYFAGLNMLKIIAFTLIIGFALTIFISNFFIKVHPVFVVVYIFLIVLAVVLSVYVSNSYETFLTDTNFGATLQSFSGGTFILLNLPIFTTAVGFLGLVFMMIGILRDSDYGGIV